MEGTVLFLNEIEQEKFLKAEELATQLKKRLKSHAGITVLDVSGYSLDPLKLSFGFNGYSATETENLLALPDINIRTEITSQFAVFVFINVMFSD